MRNGASRQAERTYRYSSIAEKRMSIRAHFIKKYKSVYIYILIHITIEILTFFEPCYIIRRVKRRAKCQSVSKYYFLYFVSS